MVIGSGRGELTGRGALLHEEVSVRKGLAADERTVFRQIAGAIWRKPLVGLELFVQQRPLQSDDTTPCFSGGSGHFHH